MHQAKTAAAGLADHVDVARGRPGDNVAGVVEIEVPAPREVLKQVGVQLHVLSRASRQRERRQRRQRDRVEHVQLRAARTDADRDHAAVTVERHRAAVARRRQVRRGGHQPSAERAVPPVRVGLPAVVVDLGQAVGGHERVLWRRERPADRHRHRRRRRGSADERRRRRYGQSMESGSQGRAAAATAGAQAANPERSPTSARAWRPRRCTPLRRSARTCSRANSPTTG